jgi:site-specific DNA recombinase
LIPVTSLVGKVQFVVVFNLTRFAREKYDHFALRAHPKSLGISLRSATEPIDDTATGKLMEGVLAAFAQFDNDVRSDSDARRNAGGTGARAVRVPGTNRTHQCTARDDKSLMHGT